MITRKVSLLLMALSLLTAIWLAGCSSDSSTAQPAESGDLNLTDVYGGYTATSEAPGFGDEEILADDDSEPALDEMASSAIVDSLGNLPNRDVYSLELLWGHLQYDSSVTTTTDWSGSLTVERGAIVAVRLINFETGDQIVRPRDTCTVLSWISHTRPYYDGLLVFIYDPNPDSFTTENTVTFATEPYTRTFTMSELDSIDEVVDVGDNQVSISGFKTVLLACQHGFFQGRWKREGDGSHGKFHGRWISADGYLLGHVKGHFGVRDDGEQVLFGKWITQGGSFRGLLRGEWGYDDEAEGVMSTSGWFNGRWDNAAGTRVGDFDANWVAAPPLRGNPHHSDNVEQYRHKGWGLWRGQWQEVCD
jgi:hypothetical protein